MQSAESKYRTTKQLQTEAEEEAGEVVRIIMGQQEESWLSHYATSRKFAGSSPG
jgi:hypothetical protein